MSGENTTAILHPTGRSDIPFDMTATTGLQDGFVIPADSLRLNLEKRREIAYSEYASDGGEATDERGVLTDLSFDVIVSGGSRAAMLQYCHELELAVATGGTFEWKPDGLDAGVRSSFFLYEPSDVPRLKSLKNNRFDGPPGEGGYYRIYLEVTLKTQPWIRSDPDAPVTVLSATTIQNAHDGTRDNFVTIPAASVVGDKPALARVIVTPKTSGQDVGRVIAFRRTAGLTDFEAVYYTSTALNPTAGWSTVTDASRIGGSYDRCQPAANNVPYGRRYTIANWDSHLGVAAIAVIYKANAEDVDDDFEIYAAWSIADTPFTGEAKAIQEVGAWRTLVLGDIDVPETELGISEELDLYIDIYVERTGGAGSISIDGIMLLYTDECVVEAEAIGDGRASTADNIIIENFKHEIAHVVTATTSKLQYILNPLGTPGLIQLKPGMNNELHFLWERAAPGLADSFDGYTAYWKKMASFELSEPWSADMVYKEFTAVRWKKDVATTNMANGIYPLDLTDGSLNTAALVTAGQMRSDGNDLRVIVNGAEVDRWLAGMNGTSTKIWANLQFAADISMSLNGGITAGATSLTVTGTITGLPSTGIVQIGSEFIYYGAKAGQVLSNLVRGYKDSTAVSHSSADPVLWLQHDIELLWGDLAASAPAVNDNYKPAFDLSLSTNTSWVFTEFGEDDGLRAANWEFRQFAGTPVRYGGNHGAAADPWEELGIQSDTTAETGWLGLYNVCGLTNANFQNGEKYRGAANWEGRILSHVSHASLASLSSPITEYVIPSPTAATTWESWSQNEALTANSVWVILHHSTNVGDSGYLEASNVTLTLNSGNTPGITLGTARDLPEGVYHVEGDACMTVVRLENGSVKTLTGTFSFPFLTTALVCVHLQLHSKASTSQSLRLRIYTDPSNYYEKTWSYARSANTISLHYEADLLSGFLTTGAPDLNHVTAVELAVSANNYCEFYIDDLRIASADPEDANAPNDTGEVWDFESGTWHVYELDSALNAIGQIEVTAGVEKVALIHTNYGQDVRFVARCKAKRDNGIVGLVFRCTDATSGSEDGYAFLMDTANDQLLLRDYAAGALSNVASPVSYALAVDTDYYLGVKVRGAAIECYISATLASLWSLSNRKFNATDSTHTSERCGLMTIGTIGRFTEVDLDSNSDRHVPNDEIDVTVEAVFQSVMPFYE